MQSLDSAIFSPKCMWEFLMFLFLAKQVWKKCNIRKLEEITQKYIPLLVTHLNTLALAVKQIFGLFPILKFPIIATFIHFLAHYYAKLQSGKTCKRQTQMYRCCNCSMYSLLSSIFCFASVDSICWTISFYCESCN